MAAILVNGNGFEGCTAQVDADFYEGLSGGVTGVMQVGRKMAAEIINNTPRVYDGVILTKEGRRIQIDYDDYVDFTIPSGATGVTAYYIIGFKLITASDDTQSCEPFVQAVESASATIPEGMLKEGTAEVYISLYRVTQDSNVNTLSSLLLTKFTTMGNDASIYYLPDMQYTLDVRGGGYLTNNLTAITFSIPLNRLTSKVTGATHVSSSLTIRQNGNYIVGSASAGASIAAFSSHTIAVKQNCLVVTVVYNAGIGGTNNAPVAVACTLTVRFTA